MEKKAVKDYMETDVESVSSDANLQDVINIMIEKNTEFVWVKDKERMEFGSDLCGIIGEEEIFDAIAGGKNPSEINAGEVMQACKIMGINPCLQIDPDASVKDAAKLMRVSGVHHALVTGATGVIGVFSVRGLINSFKE